MRASAGLETCHASESSSNTVRRRAGATGKKGALPLPGGPLTAVRVHDPFRFVPSSFWYGKPSMDPELEGWWQVFSLAVYSGYERIALEDVFTRNGLVHEQAGADVVPPSPLPKDSARPPAGPPSVRSVSAALGDVFALLCFAGGRIRLAPR